MELTHKEITLVKAAIKSRNKSHILQPVLFAFLVLSLLALLFGFLSGSAFVYLAVPLIFIAILLPQLGGSPKYHQLVEILEKQIPQNQTMEDILANELRKANKN